MMDQIRHCSFKFEPFSTRQQQLLTWWMPQSPYHDYDMVIAEGSVRSGKTISGIDSFITWSLHSFRDKDFILAGRSSGALERNVLRPMFQILTAKGIKYTYRRGDNRQVIIGTNVYHCFGANNEKSQDAVQGLTAAGAFLDEAALFPISFLEQVKARCSVDHAKIWLNCNPESPFHPIKTDYIDKAKEVRALVLHFTMDDNLSLSEAVKDRYRRMFTGIWHKRFILGLWVQAEGAIYDMWDEAFHVADSLPDYPHHFVSCDYGTANPCTFGLYGYSSVNDVSLLSEYWHDSTKAGAQKTDGQYAADLKDWLKESLPGGRRPRAIYVDPSAASFIAELKDKGYMVADANNDVLEGIRFVSKMLADRKYRVHRSCANTLKEYVSYVWDPKAQLKGEDKPVKSNDHAMDRDRYALFTHFGPGRLMDGADLS
jgi:PBSX family phage terminase large subunit